MPVQVLQLLGLLVGMVAIDTTMVAMITIGLVAVWDFGAGAGDTQLSVELSGEGGNIITHFEEF